MTVMNCIALGIVYELTVLYIISLFQGYERIYNEIPDINLDVPHSYSVLERFVEECFQAGIISRQLRDLCPSRYLVITFST